MTAISEREAKTQYLQFGRDVLGYSLKVASTYVYAHKLGRVNKRGDREKTSRLGQAEALKMREQEGCDVHLIVRHPLDRLVSGWLFFTKKANTAMRYILEADPRDHNILLGCNEFKGVEDLELWFDASTRHYNPHWFSQAEYHSRDGELVPNILWPIESLKFMPATADEGIINSTKNVRVKPSWEDYFESDSFRKRVEDYYAADIELYEKSKEMWNGREAPSILRCSK